MTHREFEAHAVGPLAHLENDELEAARRQTLAAEYLCEAFREGGARGYAEGGWWGLDPKSPYWFWNADASNHMAFELEFHLKMKADWQPTAKEIRKRIDEILRGKNS